MTDATGKLPASHAGSSDRIEVDPPAIPMTPKVADGFDYGAATRGVQVPSQPRFVPLLAQGAWPPISDGFVP